MSVSEGFNVRKTRQAIAGFQDGWGRWEAPEKLGKARKQMSPQPPGKKTTLPTP